MPDTLEQLWIAGLEKVTRLPQLPAERLTLLHVYDTAISELPSSLPLLEELQCGSPQLQRLPAMPSCTLLHMECCLQLEQLPEQLPAGLESLNCSGCSGLQQLPAQLPRTLESLWLNNCTALKQMPEQLPASLICLTCSGCSALQQLPAHLPPQLEVLWSTSAQRWSSYHSCLPL